MLKKVLIGIAIAIGVIIVLLLAFLIRTLCIAGEFKSIQPHSDYSVVQVECVGPEDVEIDVENGIAYISSSDRRAAQRGEESQGAIYGYSLTSDKPELVNLTQDFDRSLHPHGISMYKSPSGQTLLFVINMASDNPVGDSKAGSTVEIFQYDEGKLKHLETFKDPLISTPNDILGVGPRQFYFSNDSGATDRIGKALELYFQLPISNVVFYDGKEFKKAAENFPNANGFAMSKDGQRLYVTSTVGKLIRVYDRDVATGALTMIKDWDMQTGVDNINMDDEGNIWAGCIPKLVTYDMSRRNPGGFAPAQVLMVTPLADDMFEVKEAFLSDGKDMSGSTCAASYKGRLFIGSAWDSKFLDCTRK
ncbi:MAG: SMP-30/gluconolactonase/LRE family protein [Dehalococcoidia bacterium]|nr:SMP-30/gluconolactonase/LRE family protein [Dehalococcoidia bacterium]